jgi:hypothetical protein
LHVIQDPMLNMDRTAFHLVCVACGGSSISLPQNLEADPTAAITCARCGAARGTLAALREASRSDTARHIVVAQTPDALMSEPDRY